MKVVVSNVYLEIMLLSPHHHLRIRYIATQFRLRLMKIQNLSSSTNLSYSASPPYYSGSQFFCCFLTSSSNLFQNLRKFLLFFVPFYKLFLVWGLKWMPMILRASSLQSILLQLFSSFRLRIFLMILECSPKESDRFPQQEVLCVHSMSFWFRLLINRSNILGNWR